jgi:hypothetical protein
LIRCSALSEYVCGGIGSDSAGGCGFAGHTATGGGELVAQAVKLSASAISITARGNGAHGGISDCFIDIAPSLRFRLSGELFSFLRRDSLVVSNLRHLFAVSPVLHLPGAHGGHGSANQGGGDSAMCV